MNRTIKAKPVKKESKGKITFFETLKGLFSNAQVVENGRAHPFWLPLILALLAVLMAITPIMVSSASASGGAILSSSTYGFDNSISYVLKDLNDEKYEFVVEEGHKLIGYKDDVRLTGSSESTLESLMVGKYESTKDEVTQYDLFVYYIPSEAKRISTYVNEASKLEYIVGTTTLKNKDVDPEGTDYYTPSHLFFYEGGIYLAIYKYNSTKIAVSTAYATSWKTTKIGTKLVEKLSTVTLKDGTEITIDLEPVEYKAGVIKNFKGVLNKAYEEAKTRNFWMTTGIYSAVDVLIIFIYGLLIFLMTRGKKNMFNYMKFLECLKISMAASFTPGLLALILGFLLAQYAYIFFIVLSGIRVMWLTMKQFKPTY